MPPIEPERAGSAHFLAQLVAALESSVVPPELCLRVIRAITDVVGDACAICLHDRKTGKLQLVGLHHSQEERAVSLRRVLEAWLRAGQSVPPQRTAWSARPVSLSVANEEEAAEVLGSVETVRLARLAGIISLLIMPLFHEDQEIGSLWIISSSGEKPFTPEKISFAAHIARDLSTTLAHLEPAGTYGGDVPPAGGPAFSIQTILDSIPRGLIVASAPEGRTIACNSSLVRLFGREPGPEVPATQCPEALGLVHPDGTSYRPEEVPWGRTARTGEPVEAEEMTVRRPDGMLVSVLCSTSPIVDDAGRTTGVVALLQDVTEHKEFERQKDEFLAMVSHELRTPLASIKGSAQFLQRRMQARPGLPMGKTDLDMLQIMDQQVNRLVRLVSDLTQYSILQVGRLELFQREFDLAVLASEVLDHMQSASPDHDLRLIVRGNTRVIADPDRIEQVLHNLISNGVKAARIGNRTKRPSVEVTVSESEGGTVLSTVRDDGVGIEKNIHDLIFTRLYRGPERSHEGMGLGLYISKGIIDAHNGKIWFESEEGKGTTFYFTLPAA